LRGTNAILTLDQAAELIAAGEEQIENAKRAWSDFAPWLDKLLALLGTVGMFVPLASQAGQLKAPGAALRADGSGPAAVDVALPPEAL
jgi:hypothetical protein